MKGLLSINETITHGKTQYKITSFSSYKEQGFTNIVKACEKTGKETGCYSASKVLKNGKLSKKVSISFLRFISNGKIIIL